MKFPSEIFLRGVRKRSRIEYNDITQLPSGNSTPYQMIGRFSFYKYLSAFLSARLHQQKMLHLQKNVAKDTNICYNNLISL